MHFSPTKSCILHRIFILFNWLSVPNSVDPCPFVTKCMPVYAENPQNAIYGIGLYILAAADDILSYNQVGRLRLIGAAAARSPTPPPLPPGGERCSGSAGAARLRPRFRAIITRFGRQVKFFASNLTTVRFIGQCLWYNQIVLRCGIAADDPFRPSP